MLPDFLLKTKLLPPRLGKRVLPRPRLARRLHSFLDRSSTIVSANAGCGKTTLVADFVHTSGLPFLWYQIDPSDVDLAVFFVYLAHGLRNLHPEFGQVVLGFIKETEDLSTRANQLADIFINEVTERIEEKTIIVLDDFHQVDSSEVIGGAIDRILRYLPDVLHVVIMSRSMPRLSITRLRSKGLVGILERPDLLFTHQEVQQLFAQTFGRPLSPEMIKQFYEKTEGWITALQLIQQSLESSTNSEGVVLDQRSSDELAVALQQSELGIFDYFAEEVLSLESQETRMRLGQLSILERIDQSICDAVFGVDDSRDQLRALARRNVFVSQTQGSGSDEEFRLHPLFRSFLRRWYVNEFGAEKMRALHLSCASYFVSTRAWEFALHHCVEAGAADQVADLMAEHGAELVRSGRLEVIKRAVENVSEETFAHRPRALIARAEVALIEGDHARALALYEQAGRIALKTKRAAVEAEALRGRAHIARYSGRWEEAIELARAAIGLAPDNHSLRARCFNIIGLCQFLSLQQPEQAIENWRSALEAAREAGDDRLARIVLHNLGLPYSVEGDFNEALRWLSQLAEGSPTAKQSSTEPPAFPQQAIAHLNIGKVKMVQGKFEEARVHLESALERCRMFNMVSWTAETLEAFGSLYRDKGEYGRGIEFYEEAARAYRDAGVPLTSCELLDERATLYLKLGELTSAAREAEEYYRARSDRSPAERAYALITRGRIEMGGARLAEAELSLREAASILHDRRLHYNEARALTSLARLLWDTKRTEESLLQLSSAIHLSIRYDYSYWLVSEALLSPPVFLAAINAGIEVAYLTKILPADLVTTEGLQAGGIRTSSRHLAAEQNANVQARMERPDYDLAIDMLGPIRVYRNPADPANEEAWRLVRSLHILCFIAARRSHRAAKDVLVETFWADADTETIAKNFHPTISHLRKALNHQQMIKKDFMLYRDGAYLLNPHYHYRIDVEEFEKLLVRAREARRSGDQEKAAQLTTQAIELYRGDFMEECYYDWVEELQSFYRDLNLEALADLGAHHFEQGDYELAVRYGQMILQRDPFREDVHCRVMEAQVRSGNRAAAIEQFDGLRKLLRRELGVEPLPATVARYEVLIK